MPNFEKIQTRNEVPLADRDPATLTEAEKVELAEKYPASTEALRNARGQVDKAGS